MPNDPPAVLAQWQLTPAQLRDRLYGAPTPRERERWHALWLLSQGWSAVAVARAFERDPHTIGAWLDDMRQHGPTALAFEHTGGPPPPSTRPARPS
jgi:Homeodomain-like domain